jgi:hypothetical protein
MDETAWRTWIRSNIQRADPLLWVIERSLACAPRPLRYHAEFGGRVATLPADAAPALRARGVVPSHSLQEHGIDSSVTYLRPPTRTIWLNPHDRPTIRGLPPSADEAKPQ